MTKDNIFDIILRIAQTRLYPNSFVKRERRPATFGTQSQGQSMLTLKQVTLVTMNLMMPRQNVKSMMEEQHH